MVKTPPPGTPWAGRWAQRARTHTLTRDKGLCHLCHHPGANSCDHLIPRSTDPTKTWDPTNWAAAHLHQAGRPGGCQTPGCTCIGNKKRQAKPVSTPPSRAW